ncbi:MAG: EI24 domain-containing protein [Bacteroidota bacterium]
MFWKKRAIKENERYFLASLKIYFEAHHFIRGNTFGKYLIFSGIFFLIFFTISIKLVINGLNSFEPFIIENFTDTILRFVNVSEEQIKEGIQTFFWLLEYAINSNKDSIFAFVFMILGTPFFSFISSKTEEIVSGVRYQFRWRIFFKEIKRGFSISIRNSFKQFGLILIITLLSFIPYFNIITPFLTFMVNAYFYGILMTDYSLERRGINVKESQIFYNKHKSQMLGIGLGFMFLLLVPVIGWFIAPTYALVAAYFNLKQILREDYKSETAPLK